MDAIMSSADVERKKRGTRDKTCSKLRCRLQIWSCARVRLAGTLPIFVDGGRRKNCCWG